MQRIKKFPQDLLIINIWTALTFIFVLFPYLEDSFIRTILGLPLVLFIPGYVLIAALFPRKNELDPTARIALSFGLSIAVVPLLGLLLNFTFGIKLVPILLSLVVFIAILSLIAASRRKNLNEKEQFSIQFDRFYEYIAREIKTPKSRNDKILTGILIISIIFAGFMIYFVIITPRIGERFTEFYILDAEGKANNYSSELKNNISSMIRVGVKNHEFDTINYTIRVLLDKKDLKTVRFKLKHNKTWEKNLTFVPKEKGKDKKLEFYLFKDNNFSLPYRELHLWVNVRK